MISASANTVSMLSGHNLFWTEDLDRAREKVAQIFCKHRLDRTSSQGKFNARHDHIRGEMLSLNYIHYGAEVEIEPGELDSFFLIQLPVRGSALIKNGNREVFSTPTNASVLNASRYTTMSWHEGCEQALIQIDKKALEKFAERILGHHLPGSIVFDPSIDLTRVGLSEWYSKVFHLFFAAQRGVAFGENNFITQLCLEQEILEYFIRRQPSNILHFFDRAPEKIHPYYIKRAFDYIRANAHKKITMLDVATDCGIAPRTLQARFRDVVGCTAKQALLHERLKLARYDLMEGDPVNTVSSIAIKWGFLHFGRFSQAYYQEYGQYPHETLAKFIQ